jgi:hypothetical protein
MSRALAPRRRTSEPATANPTTIPVGKEATSSPMVAGPAPVASAIGGATGTIRL